MKNSLVLLVISMGLFTQKTVVAKPAPDFTIVATTTVNTEVGIARFKASSKAGYSYSTPIKVVHEYVTEKPTVTIEFIQLSPPPALDLLPKSAESRIHEAGYRQANVEELASITTGVKGIKNPVMIAYGSYLNNDDKFPSYFQVNISDKSDIVGVEKVSEEEKKKSPIAVVKLKK